METLSRDIYCWDRESESLLYIYLYTLLLLYCSTRALTPLNQLLLTLRFYATGSFLRSSGDLSGVCISTACRIVKKVSAAIAALRPTEIQMPQDEREIRKTMEGFYRMHRFPRVIGCIDCTHIRIQSPGGDNAEVFRNRKGYFSFNVQVVCDHNLKATDIVVRWPGSSHDATIFEHSNLRRRLEQNEFPSGLLLGDGGYPVRNYLLTPLLNPNTPAEQCYNDTHIRTRNIIERYFGVVKRRFPVLSLGMRLALETIQDVIVATAVLHNVARDRNEEEPRVEVDAVDDEIIDDDIVDQHARPQNNAIRNRLIADYFSR